MDYPSIVPNDRLDRDFYIVLEDFKGGAAFRETDEGSDYHTLITDLLSGQFSQVLRVVAFNPAEGQLGRKIGVQLPLPLRLV
jgi:hypothetical protein